MKWAFPLLIQVIFSFHASGQKLERWNIDSLQSYISSQKGVLVIDFWATFCKPCVQEIPDIINQIKQFKQQGVSLLLVSLDLPVMYPQKLLKFVRKNNYSVPVVWLDETNADYFCPIIDSSWSGSIPATIFINTNTGYRKFIESSLTHAEFEAELKLTMGSSR